MIIVSQNVFYPTAWDLIEKNLQQLKNGEKYTI